MAKFRDKILKTLVERASDSIKAASGIADITERTDALVAAREENDKNFGKTARRQLLKVAGFAALGLAGAAAAVVGLMTATSMVAVLAGTSGFAIPLAVAGFALEGVSAIGIAVSSGNYSDVAKAREASASASEQALNQLAKTYPAETAKSSRLSAFLKRTFNPAAKEAPNTTAPKPNAPAVQAATPKP